MVGRVHGYNKSQQLWTLNIVPSYESYNNFLNLPPNVNNFIPGCNYIYINYVRTFQLLYHQGPLFSFYGVNERINTLAKRLFMPQDKNHMEKICLIWIFLFFVEYERSSSKHRILVRTQTRSEASHLWILVKIAKKNSTARRNRQLYILMWNIGQI